MDKVPDLPPLFRELDVRAVHRRTAIPGGEMSWRIWGEGSPAVLVHGMHGSWTHWLRNIGPLSTHRTVIVPDMPGFGDSDRGTMSGMDAYSAAISDGLDQLGVGSRFDLVAFSFGSTISFHFPDILRDRVRRLVLIGSAGLGPFRRASLDLTSWRGVEDPVDRARIHRANLGIMMFSDPASIQNGAVAIQMQNTERMTLRRKDLIRTSDALARFTAWRPAEVDFIWGSEDMIIRDGLAETGEIILRIVPHARLHVIEGAGHWVQYEQADAVNELLARL
ncbi:alpha/beta fold hydrolase [Rhodobacterales bacterium HKCCE2091]|nr:alpha/beta fold hydrolase [Rhodobacterales bacterium HKCCE2091]